MRGLADVDPADIVHKVVLRAWEKRQKLAKYPNLMGWFVDACKKNATHYYGDANASAGSWGCLFLGQMNCCWTDSRTSSCAG